MCRASIFLPGPNGGRRQLCKDALADAVARASCEPRLVTKEKDDRRYRVMPINLGSSDYEASVGPVSTLRDPHLPHFNLSITAAYSTTIHAEGSAASAPFAQHLT
jgi:hypothetical protein